MVIPESDDRSPERRALDEAIAAEAPLPPPPVPAAGVPKPIEALLPKRRPVAVAGIVQNGLVRPLDPAVRLAEQSRVIIVAAE